MVLVMLLKKQGQLIRIARNSWLKIYAVNALIDIILDRMDFVKKLILFVILMKHQLGFVLLASLGLLWLMEDVLSQVMISLIKIVRLGKEKYVFNAHKAHSLVQTDYAK